MFVLDSNIAIAALNGEQAVLRHFDDIARSQIGLPAVVVAELLYDRALLDGSISGLRTENWLADASALRS